MPPHPYTFNHGHLRAIETAALAACKDPLKPPNHEEAEAFAASLPASHPHVASATYNRAMRRIEVTLHGGGIGFPVPLRTEPLVTVDPKVTIDGADVTVTWNIDGDRLVADVAEQVRARK